MRMLFMPRMLGIAPRSIQRPTPNEPGFVFFGEFREVPMAESCGQGSTLNAQGELEPGDTNLTNLTNGTVPPTASLAPVRFAFDSW